MRPTLSFKSFCLKSSLGIIISSGLVSLLDLRPTDQTPCGGEQIRPMMQDRMYCGLVTHPAVLTVCASRAAGSRLSPPWITAHLDGRPTQSACVAEASSGPKLGRRIWCVYITYVDSG